MWFRVAMSNHALKNRTSLIVVPIILEHLQTPSEEDWQDLEQIFASVEPSIHLSRKDIEPQLSQSFWIIAGRFNDRLAGCLLAQKSHSNQVNLSQACVRKLTQGRGVMHQMLALMVTWADSQSLELIFNNVPEHLQKALVNRGFESSKDKTWIRKKPNKIN